MTHTLFREGRARLLGRLMFRHTTTRHLEAHNKSRDARDVLATRVGNDLQCQGIGSDLDALVDKDREG